MIESDVEVELEESEEIVMIESDVEVELEELDD